MAKDNRIPQPPLQFVVLNLHDGARLDPHYVAPSVDPGTCCFSPDAAALSQIDDDTAADAPLAAAHIDEATADARRQQE